MRGIDIVVRAYRGMPEAISGNAEFNGDEWFVFLRGEKNRGPFVKTSSTIVLPQMSGRNSWRTIH